MANEATKVELYGNNNSGDQRRYTVADAVAITKGTVLQLLDPRTASAAITEKVACAGIAAMDKEASDGSTSISAWTNGVFEMVASDAITIGAPVGLANTANYVFAVGSTAASGAYTIGYALEAASVGETINVRVRL